MNNIYLTGMMGSGKSSVARLLADKLGREALELDERIVKHEAKSINDIFAENGEPYFRAIEKRILKNISNERDLVVSTGGGIVLDPENNQMMKSSGAVIYLFAPIEVLYERLKDKSDRPLLKVEAPLKKLHEIYDKRQKLYQQADYTIDTTAIQPEEVAIEIIKRLKIGKSI